MSEDMRIAACLKTATKGKAATGKQEWINHLNGGALTMAQAIKAKCYDCCCGYADEKGYCGVATCALSQFMPYNKERRKVRKGRVISEEERARIGERLAAARRKI